MAAIVHSLVAFFVCAKGLIVAGYPRCQPHQQSVFRVCRTAGYWLKSEVPEVSGFTRRWIPKCLVRCICQ